jgi:hypothetical protein
MRKRIQRKGGRKGGRSKDKKMRKKKREKKEEKEEKAPIHPKQGDRAVMLHAHLLCTA